MLLPIKGIAITFANEFIGMFEDWDASFVWGGEVDCRSTAPYEELHCALAFTYDPYLSF